MPVIGLHCSHEQIPPSRLLTHVREAEAAGFGAAMSSDHFSPWSERQGESGFAWSFLGAALQATELPFGVVNAPGQRYHPAIVAQAAATLCELFPGGRWRRPADPPAGSPQLGGHRRGGSPDRTRPVAHERIPSAAVLGPRNRRAVRRRGTARAPGGPDGSRSRVGGPRPAYRVAGGAEPTGLRADPSASRR